MKRTSFIIIWIACFIFISIAISWIHNAQSKTQSDYPTVYFAYENETVEVLDRQELNQRSNPNPIAQTRYVVDRQAGPIAGVFEAYETTSCFLPEIQIYSRQSPISQELKDQTYTALIEYAKSDPKIAPYQPGQPPITRFAPALLQKSILRISILIGIAWLLAWLNNCWFKATQRSVNNHRRTRNQCIHCTYDCTNIQSPTCPECGQPHTVPLDSPNLESNA